MKKIFTLGIIILLFYLIMIDLHIKNLDITDKEKELVYAKVEKLTHLWGRLQDESVSIKIEIDRDNVRAKEEAIICSVTIFAPGKIKLFASTQEATIKNAIDQIEKKLRKEIETAKGKKG